MSSTDPKKSLTIKTGSVRRLGADYRSYQVEYDQYQRQLSQAQESQQDTHTVKKHRELVDECVATMHEISDKLTEAVTALQSFMAVNTELVGTQEWEKAQKILNDNRSHLTAPLPSSSLVQSQPIPESKTEEKTSLSSTAVEGGATLDGGDIHDKYVVAVYGGSQNKSGDGAWDAAVTLGRALATAGCHVVNGGYSGLMEAVSAGVREVAGGTVEGIISPVAFPFQTPRGNQYLTHHTVTSDLPQRVITFLSRAQAFVVLPGSLGTLTELCLTWDVSAVSTLRQQQPLLLLAYREPWQRVIDAVRAIIPISEHFMSVLKYVDSTEQIIEEVERARSHWKTSSTNSSQ